MRKEAGAERTYAGETIGELDQQSGYVTEKSGNGKAVWVIAIARPDLGGGARGPKSFGWGSAKKGQERQRNPTGCVESIT